MRRQILIPNFDPTCYQMSYMFKGATAFNQDMCHFGDNWSWLYFGNVFDMFSDSGCGNTNQPTGASGPWCAVTTCS